MGFFWAFLKLILVGLVADYILGASCVALYLSVRYHTLQPDYIHERLKTLGKGHRLRVLLVHVDVKVGYHFELLILQDMYTYISRPFHSKTLRIIAK